MEYQISNKAKKWSTGVLVVGIVLFAIGVITGMGGVLFKTRIMANLLANSFFFFNIAISALFFLAVHYVAEVGWSTVVKRPLEAITGYLPVGIGLLLVTLVTMYFLNGGGVYDWMNPEIMNEGGAHYDEISASKGGYMGIVFFWVRTLSYFLVYFMMWRGFIKRSRQQDNDATNALTYHYKNFNRGALFLLLFAFFSSMSSWDWLMSIDLHWHSTLFGWYTFSGGWVSAMVMLVVLLIYLKKLGYLPNVNENHIHDIGKWIFGLSFLWSYLWFSQFMLIWYSDMPEEVGYFVTRVESYKLLFFGMFIINFIFPMLILISRDAKRHSGALMIVSFIIIVGHWIDTWIMVMGGSMGPVGKMGLLEIGMGLIFLMIFVRVVLAKLAEAPLVSANDPYLEESIHHEI